MQIEKVTTVTKDLLDALQVLVPQLSARKTPLSVDELNLLLESEGTHFLVARWPDENGPIVGMLTLIVYRVPTGIRSIIEDVVVAEAHRRRGFAEALMQEALSLAKNAGAKNVALTSNPQREAANHLYRALGFKLRQTNAYLFELD